MCSKVSGYDISIIFSSDKLSDVDIQTIADKITDLFGESDSVNVSVKPILEDDWTLDEESALELANSVPRVVKDTGIPSDSRLTLGERNMQAVKFLTELIEAQPIELSKAEANDVLTYGTMPRSAPIELTEDEYSDFMAFLNAPRDESKGAKEVRRTLKRVREIRKSGVFKVDPRKDE